MNHAAESGRQRLDPPGRPRARRCGGARSPDAHALRFLSCALVLTVMACAPAEPEVEVVVAEAPTITLGPDEMPYDIVEGWITPFAAEGFAFGGNSGVYAPSSDRIVILQRGETKLQEPVPDSFAGYMGSIGINVLRGYGRTWQNVLYTVDADGDVQEIWNQWDRLFEGTDGPGPHRIRVNPYDAEQRLWVVNETGQQIYVLSNDGAQLLMTLGEKDVAGTDETHFGKPQDVAFLPDGRMLIADGYDSGRVIVADADANYLSEFGSLGEEDGQFRVVHGVAVGPDNRVYVVDRDNRRIHLFRENEDPDGPPFEWVSAWGDFGMPLDIIVGEERVWVTALQPVKIAQFDLDGNHVYTFNLPTEGPTKYLEAHSFAVDPEGNLYASDNQWGRTQKFVPKAGVDRSLLVGRPYVAR